MNLQPEVPEPEESGSDGQQVRAEDKEDLSLPQPVGRPMTDAITGLASSNSRAFGGEVASTLIAGATSQMSVELDQTRKELTEQRKQNDQLNRELSDEKIRSAVLAERISSFRSTRHLKNLGIAVGTLIFGTGVQLVRGGSQEFGIAGIAVGVLLLFFSWLSAPKGGDK